MRLHAEGRERMVINTNCSPVYAVPRWLMIIRGSRGPAGDKQDVCGRTNENGNCSPVYAVPRWLMIIRGSRGPAGDKQDVCGRTNENG
ncbi:Hypothetical protein SMAX5B_016329 [Scophthalmus maximus]|uniref:Uncharacterized protein n=1 Tax=Scophthalmus maximus TaxID=52904 RepID=A0A2U9BLB1_SCOMX|nr:Hypothetical protein SMAX5B_016329 [Scophthalmus maximus]